MTSPDPVGPNRTPEGRAWAEQLAAWAIPDEILAQASEPPWVHDPATFAVDDTLSRDTLPARLAREVLPPSGATVLDVGCGGGRSSLVLAPPAERLIGFDENPAMLERFAAACDEANVVHAEVMGRWPDQADLAPVADVVVCHHVLYNVPDVEPFLDALTAHARLAVVVVLPERHPMSAWNEAWQHFWGLERPAGPTSDDAVAVLRALGHEPEVHLAPRPPLSRHAEDPAELAPSACRRLCLSPDREPEVAAYLADHPPAFMRQVVVLRWPGTAG